MFEIWIRKILTNSILFIVPCLGPLPTTLEGFKYVLTFTDYFTKFVDFFPLKEKAAAEIARCIQTFLCRSGKFH
jgi:hypothetical protein